MEPKTEIFILPHILSIALSFHGCPHITCPLCLLPSVSSVWATALDDSGSEYCPLTPVSHLFSFYVWLFSYSLGFSVSGLQSPPPRDSLSGSLCNHVSRTYSLCLPLPDLCGVPGSTLLPFPWLCGRCFPKATRSLLCPTHSLSAAIYMPSLPAPLSHQTSSRQWLILSAGKNIPKTYLFRESALLSRSDSGGLKYSFVLKWKFKANLRQHR